MDPITDFCDGPWSFIPDSLRTRKDIPATAKVVYTALTHRARIGRAKLYAHPSIRCLAEDTGLDTRTCQRAVQILTEEGYVTIEHRERENGSARSNRYHLVPLSIPDRGCGNPDGGGVGNVSPLEAEEVEEENKSADKPRVEVKENPTPTEPKSERVIIPAEDTVPYRPLAREKKPPKPLYLAIGQGIQSLWCKQVYEACVGPPLATWSERTLVKAAKTFLALKDTPFADKSAEEVFALLVARLKMCSPFVRKSVNFGWLFCAEDNLARMLAGDWDVGAGEIERPKEREIPENDQWPGMDKAAYWREKDKEKVSHA